MTYPDLIEPCSIENISAKTREFPQAIHDYLIATADLRERLKGGGMVLDDPLGLRKNNRLIHSLGLQLATEGRRLGQVVPAIEKITANPLAVTDALMTGVIQECGVIQVAFIADAKAHPQSTPETQFETLSDKGATGASAIIPLKKLEGVERNILATLKTNEPLSGRELFRTMKDYEFHHSRKTVDKWLKRLLKTESVSVSNQGNKKIWTITPSGIKRLA